MPSNRDDQPIRSYMAYDLYAVYLDAWISSIIVWTPFARYTSRWTAFALIPEAHTSLFWLLKGLNTGLSY